MLKLFKPSDETKLVLNTLNPASLIRILSYIGGGAHGKVYKIYNMLDDQVYSLKKKVPRKAALLLTKRSECIFIISYINLISFFFYTK
jgi:hypothetical protein